MLRRCNKQHEVKPSTRENDVIERHRKPEIDEAAARVTQRAALQQTFYINTNSTLNVMIKSIL